jgi:hypothetical protein
LLFAEWVEVHTVAGCPTPALNLNAWSMAVAITLGRGTNRPREDS